MTFPANESNVVAERIAECLSEGLFMSDPAEFFETTAP